MARFAVPPGATLGVKLPDGTVYRPSRSGSIEVTDRKHISQLRAHNSAKNLDMLIEQNHMPVTKAGRDCSECSFAAWPWSRQCPRCGTMLV